MEWFFLLGIKLFSNLYSCGYLWILTVFLLVHMNESFALEICVNYFGVVRKEIVVDLEIHVNEI